MPVVSTHRDDKALTLAFVAEFDASPERVWQMWADPRKLERWWGPPSWPATFDRYELTEGGQCRYHMTGPGGTKVAGWWTVTSVEEPHRLEFDDGFAGDDGEPLDRSEATHEAVILEPLNGDRTRMTTAAKFKNAEQLKILTEMGMEEGMREALGQIDALLAQE